MVGKGDGINGFKGDIHAAKNYVGYWYVIELKFIVLIAIHAALGK